jgi:outer membrane protein TolC
MHHRIRSIPGVTALVATLIAAPVGSAATRAEDVHPDSALARTLRAIEGTPLTLSGALVYAFEGATSLNEAEASLASAKAIVQRERGAFDPEIFASLEKSAVDAPTASPFAGAEVLETEDVSTRAGARMRLPIGTELEAAVTMDRRETNSTFATLDPEYAGSGELSITQPLLNGFGPSTRGSLSFAKHQARAAEAAYADAEAALRAAVEQTYWDLYAAERNAAVETLFVERAQALLTDVQTRARAGLVGPADIANAEVFLAEREQAAMDAALRMDEISDRLGSLIGARPQGALRRFRATDTPTSTFSIEDEERSLAKAYEANHRLRSLDSNLHALRALERGAAWSALPDLDLVGRIGGNGLSGTPQTVVFGTDTLRTTIDGNGSDVLDQIAGRDFPTWSVGLELRVPLGLRSGRGERARLRAEVARVEEQRVALRRTIEEHVRAASRELAQSAKRLETAQRGVDASHEQVRAGIIEYRHGRTTAFELVRLSADLASAQERLSQALVRAAKADATLRYLTGGSGR